MQTLKIAPESECGETCKPGRGRHVSRIEAAVLAFARAGNVRGDRELPAGVVHCDTVF